MNERGGNDQETQEKVIGEASASASKFMIQGDLVHDEIIERLQKTHIINEQETSTGTHIFSFKCVPKILFLT